MAFIILSDAVMIFLPLFCTNISWANKGWKSADWLEFLEGNVGTDGPI